MNQATPSACPLPPITRPRKRLRRILLTLACLALLIPGGLFILEWSASSELNGIIAEIDRLDPDWRLEDIEAKRKVVADADNSALLIMAVRKLHGGQMVNPPAMEKMFKDLSPQVELSEQQAAELEKRCDVLRKALLEARKLKDMPEGRWPIKYDADFVSTPTTVSLLDALIVGKSLELDATRRVHAADADGTVDSCLAIQHAGQSTANDAVPTDPYDGKPIRLERMADGLVVYSVGPGKDQGFRLWDVSRRRQPPNSPVVES